MEEIEVYKFGGAAIKDVAGIQNCANIVKNIPSKLLIVASAIGDTTNKLEALTSAFIQGNSTLANQLLENIKNTHFKLVEELFQQPAHVLLADLSNTFVEVEWILEEPAQDDKGYLYDQIVSIGELLSTKIIAAYLEEQKAGIVWMDARNFIKTDNNYQEATVNWELTHIEVNAQLKDILENNTVITQGFIGSSSENFTTTLGRDGSDYSAAIFCACLDAKSLTIWKDVPGVLNADPKWFDETEHIPSLSYHDAIELSYYGANVIHPKTIKPLQNKNIPLFVKSFKEPASNGTSITNLSAPLPVPSFIFKVNQVLISIFPKDFSFIIEENLSTIFRILHTHKIKVNTMLNAALSFSISVDYKEGKIESLIEELSETFKVKYNKNLELVTVRYYDQETLDRICKDKKILLEVKSRHTCQMVMKDTEIE